MGRNIPAPLALVAIAVAVVVGTGVWLHVQASAPPPSSAQAPRPDAGTPRFDHARSAAQRLPVTGWELKSDFARYRFGEAWSDDVANDPHNLLAVGGGVNFDKAFRDAASWLPPNAAFRCEFVARQVTVKTAYGLSVSAKEKQAMQDLLAGC